jgi:hypothetical protein
MKPNKKAVVKKLKTMKSSTPPSALAILAKSKLKGK